MQIPQGINAYEALMLASEEDEDCRRGLDSLHQAMKETGVKMDNSQAVRDVGDLVIRLSYVAAEHEGFTVSAEVNRDLGPYLDTYERWVELTEYRVVTKMEYFLPDDIWDAWNDFMHSHEMYVPGCTVIFPLLWSFVYLSYDRMTMWYCYTRPSAIEHLMNSWEEL